MPKAYDGPNTQHEENETLLTKYNIDGFCNDSNALLCNLRLAQKMQKQLTKSLDEIYNTLKSYHHQLSREVLGEIRNGTMACKMKTENRIMEKIKHTLR